MPQLEKQGGLVLLDQFPGARSYIESRSGSSADQYKSPDGSFYQMPRKMVTEPGPDGFGGGDDQAVPLALRPE